MVKLIETMAKALVDNPDEVIVTEAKGTYEDVYKLEVAESDMGKIIGKQGFMATSLRSVVKAAAKKQNRNATIQIVSK